MTPSPDTSRNVSPATPTNSPPLTPGLDNIEPSASMPEGLEASASAVPTDNGSTSGLTRGKTDGAPSGTAKRVPSGALAGRPAWVVQPTTSAASVVLGLAIAIMIVGWIFNSLWLGLAGALIAGVLSIRILWSGLEPILGDLITPNQRKGIIAAIALLVSVVTLLKFAGAGAVLNGLYQRANWDAIGSLGEVIGAVGQILIAILAVYVAWRQYVISKDLTIQQNLITQQQTIDSYFQGISDLVLDAEGLLEDWPQERAIAEGRTAAILGSVDAGGKAKVIRFLSRSRLLSPLRRDRHLGRAILDGMGGYEEDRDYGVRVIDLGVMLAGASLAGSDLRWTDLSDANLIRADMKHCDLVKTNLARTILCEADLSGSDMMGTRLFYGPVKTASPRSRTMIPDYKTGEHTGAVVENVNLTDVKRLSEDQRWYCCAWGGSETRATVPGGCDDVPNLLGR